MGRILHDWPSLTTEEPLRQPQMRFRLLTAC